MTEEEAKTKWCKDRAHSLTLMLVVAAIDKDEDSGLFLAKEPQTCIASECMHWEPYEYWECENGQVYSRKCAGLEGKWIKGGDCGLKSQQCGYEA